MHTVELTFDPDTDAAVRAGWQRLAAAGLPSQARHSHASNRPHVTLATVDALPGAPALVAALAVLPLPVRLGPLLCFGGRTRVLAWAVVPDAALLDLHAAIWRALTGAGRPDPPHAPGRWTPHVTLARRLDAPALAAAVAVLDGPADVTGALTAARSYDTVSREVTPLPGR